MPKGVYERKPESLESRFWKKVDKKGEDECWVYTGQKDEKGYGRICFNYKNILAHRVSLQIKLGRPIAEGMNCLHQCDNPSCVNPNHLREGTQAENLIEMTERGRRASLKGIDNAHNKLSEDEVIEMRKLYSEGFSQHSLSKKFNVCHTTVWAIVNRKKWVHLP